MLALALVAPSALASGAPSDSTLPTVEGTPRDENTLRIYAGNWHSETPITFSYAWQLCNSSGGECVSISGAEGEKYKLIHEDVGRTLRGVVTASNAEGSATATSPATRVVVPAPPRKLTRPTLSGKAQDGQLLLANTGTWRGTPPITFTYQWQECASKICTNIAGAQAQSYRLVTSEIGKRVRVIVFAHNAAGTAKALSPSTATIVAGPPVNTAAPSVEGTPIDGQTLTASTGTWAGTGPFSYAYQWYSCSLLTGECSLIPGATGSTYTAGPLDVTNSLEVEVTASNGVGRQAVTSPQTSVVEALAPSNIELPSLAGRLLDGELLSVITGAWKGTPPLEYAYEWLQCNAQGESCKTVSEAAASTLTLTSALVGSTIRVAVTARNAGGSSSAISEPTGLIAGALPSNIELPKITGSLIDGQTLSALTGSWHGSTPLSFAYQWQRCNAEGEACEDISGAEAATFGLVSSLVGDTLRVVVTATNSAGSTAATSSATSAVAALLPESLEVPKLLGNLVDGQTLSATTGSWKGTTPISYAYRWQRCNAAGEGCKDIAGAEATTLGLVSSLVGETVRVIVTATNAAGSVSAASPVSSPVAALLPGNTELPKLAGSLIDGETLSVSSGAWSGTTPISYAYQWQMCNGQGEACTNISGAEAATYTLTSALVGDTVRAIVTATNSAGSTSATTAPTSVIAALLPSSTALPSIVGTLVDGETLTASTGTWKGTTPISYAYQWQKCNGKGEACTNISGAEAATFGLVSSLVGSTVRVVVKATNQGGSSEAASPATGVIAALLPKLLSAPSVSSSTKEVEQGSTLTAASGSWKGTEPITYSYQWQQCNGKGEECKTLAGETKETLSIVESLVKSTVRVVVRATNQGGSSEATSAPTSVVLAALPVNTKLPTISGLLEVGKTLTAHKETWAGTAPAFTYQWQLCGALGLEGECKNIAGATKETFLLELLDVGLTLRVAVTGTNERGSSTAYSKVTGLVQGLKLSPTKGTSGTNVVLKADGVGSATSVNFGSTEVTPEVKSSSEIVAPAPEGSGTVPVTVSTSEGTTHETPTDQFTYSP